MKKDSVKESIRKLLMKANDSGATIAEKDEAYLMAQRLMLKHSIEVDELEEKTHEQRRIEEVYHKPCTNYMSLNFWHRGLAGIISQNFRCIAYIDRWHGDFRDKDAKKKRLMMFGMREDVEIAVEVFESAYDLIEKFSKEYVESRVDVPKEKRVAVRNDFITGYLEGLKVKFDQQVEKYQLVIAVNALVKKENENMGFVNARPSSRKTAQDSHAKASGYAKGRAFTGSSALLK